PLRGIVDGARAEHVLGYLVEKRLLDPGSTLRPPPLAVRDVMRVHDPDYLATLDDPRVLERIFASRRREGADPIAILEAQRAATAGTVHAARLALQYPWIRSPVVNLGGGFHHARRAAASGFCAFNDVAIAIDRVRAAGYRDSILVIDFDAHHGDGTRSIFADDPTVTTYSIHTQTLDDTLATAALDVELGPAIGDETYLAAIEETLEEAFERAQPKLVFYLAGADVAATDALADWRVSADAIAARDRRVLTRASGIPTVMVLAGGYGPNAFRYTARTLAWLLSGDDPNVPTVEEAALKSFRRIRRSIEDTALRGDPERADPFRISESDVYGDLYAKSPDRRFLSFYSSFGLELAFERYGLADHLRSRGYDAFVIDGEPRADGQQGLRVYADSTRHDVLIELSLAERVLESGARLLSIEWLLLQDPKRANGEPLLPGQKYPGLGCLRIVVGMLVMAAERLGYDGLTLVPSHFHVAAQARRLFTFMEAGDEAHYLALMHATHGLSLAEASARLLAGGVVERTSGEPQKYKPARMVLAVSEKLKARFTDPAFSRAVEAEARQRDFVLRGTA
ncbi:MAG: histone deacetylase, partial [Myxococcales bacterium]|nr:histone deacetylase [Myxococcales bacterium]